MSSDRAILLISDRPERSRGLANVLGRLCACRTIGLHEPDSIAGPVTAVVTDVVLRQPTDIERLRRLLSQPRIIAVPIIAILRDNTHLQRVQATALGATALLPGNVSVAGLTAVLAPIIGAPAPQAVAAKILTPAQNAEQARLQFGTIFAAAARGEAVSRASVEDTTASVMAAITDGGIRQWLEVVWNYDDFTYQHCLLVTGLAAEFAASLRFAKDDQQHVIRGALLHDLGKAKIPLAILNKPTPLTGEEIAIMRSHARIGYELLRGQGEYEPELLEVVLWHHELLDGSGYPDGLVGSQISDLVRLATICDIYASLIERRPYRPAIEPPKAFQMLQDMEGKLEGALVRAFAQVAERSASPFSPNRADVAPSAPVLVQGGRPSGPAIAAVQSNRVPNNIG
jgi:putative nucleotidyltransferase with HDIG domain